MKTQSSRSILIMVISGILFILLGAFTVSKLLDNQKAVEDKVYRRDFSKAIPVKIATVKLQTLAQTQRLLGTFEPNREIQVVSQTQGEIVQMPIEDGDAVSAGSLLAKVDDDQLHFQLQAAEAALADARREVARYENLTKSDAVAKIQLDKAQLQLASSESQVNILKKQLALTRITAPFGGIITRRMADKGSVLSPGMPLAQLTDISSLKLHVDVPENQLLAFRIGQEVNIVTDVHPTAQFRGKVVMVGAKGDEAHNFPVHIEVANSREFPLRAGMYGAIQFDAQQKSQTLAIPREALVGSSKDARVYVVRNGVAYLQPITLGLATATELEVLSGLQPGEEVVIGGQISLTDSAAVSIE